MVSLCHSVGKKTQIPPPAPPPFARPTNRTGAFAPRVGVAAVAPPPPPRPNGPPVGVCPAASAPSWQLPQSNGALAAPAAVAPPPLLPKSSCAPSAATLCPPVPPVSLF